MMDFLEKGSFSVATLMVLLFAVFILPGVAVSLRHRRWWWQLASLPLLASCGLYLLFDHAYDALPLRGGQTLEAGLAVFDKAWTWYEASVAVAGMIIYGSAQLSYLSWTVCPCDKRPVDAGKDGMLPPLYQLTGVKIKLMLVLCYPLYALCASMAFYDMWQLLKVFW